MFVWKLSNSVGCRNILEAARLIGAYVKDTTESDFHADKQKQDAVIRRIEIIGEATAHVTLNTA